jgi:hypothetical protein
MAIVEGQEVERRRGVRRGRGRGERRERYSTYKVSTEQGASPSCSVLNKSNKSNLAFGFDLNLIREVEI